MNVVVFFFWWVGGVFCMVCVSCLFGCSMVIFGCWYYRVFFFFDGFVGEYVVYVGECFNSIFYFVGVVLLVVGFVVFVMMGVFEGDLYKVVSFSVYGVMLILFYVILIVYYSVCNLCLKVILQKCDYLVIYLLIVGSYMLFMLVMLCGLWGWLLFGVSWGFVVFGIVQELMFGCCMCLLLMILYVLMGWFVFVVVCLLIYVLLLIGIVWFVVGGVIYSVGIYFFINDECICYGYGIWYFFVLVGSLCQFVSVVMYVV